MLKLFDKTFFKFVLGFFSIISLSFVFLYGVGYYYNKTANSAATTVER
jgi:hypothetical protein